MGSAYGMFWPSFYSSARVDDDVILRVVSVLGHWVEFPLVLQLLEVEVAVGGGDLQNPIFWVFYERRAVVLKK